MLQPLEEPPLDSPLADFHAQTTLFVKSSGVHDYVEENTQPAKSAGNRDAMIQLVYGPSIIN